MDPTPGNMEWSPSVYPITRYMVLPFNLFKKAINIFQKIPSPFAIIHISFNLAEQTGVFVNME